MNAPGSSLAVPLPDSAAPGLYIHIPFCRYICPYCDFNVYANQSELIPGYLSAVAGELALLAERWPSSQEVATIFIGGGTPSLLTADQIEQILLAVDQTLGVRAGAEITMESNPDNLSHEYCAGLLRAGIRRISMGVQSMQQPGLKVLGRLHGAQGARDAFNAARSAGFENISLDLIYGWPGQTRAQLDDDLRTVLEWDVEHISCYALIVEEGTPLSTAVLRGQLHPVDDDTVAEYYDVIVDTLGTAGFAHYEISNWARNDVYRSLHNQIYWQNGTYFGVGAGAHGYLGSERMSNIRLPLSYIEAVKSGSLPVAGREVIDPELAMSESMILGLRLMRDGVSASDFAIRHDRRLESQFGDLIDRFVALGLVTWENGRVRLTEQGAMVSNSVLAEFLP